MVSVKNTTKGDIGIGGGVIIPAMQSRLVDASTLKEAKANKIVQSYFSNEWLVEAKPKASKDPAPKAQAKPKSD